MKIKIWYVYIVQCADNSYYTGITTDLSKRVEKHNAGKAAKYTRGRTPVKLIYSEKIEDESQARKREFEIKALGRKEKEGLIKTPLKQCLLPS